MVTSPPPLNQSAVIHALEVLDQKPVYLDTETTGLKTTDEIVEISIIDHDGSVIFSSFVKPSQQIPGDAEIIHGITNTMVSGAKTWPYLWGTEIRSLLFGRLIAAYNSPFDQRMMEQSMLRYKVPWREKMKFLDVMTLFSEYRGEWDPIRNSMRMFKLEDAGAFFNIPLPNAHRSTADALLTRAVLHCIAGIPY